MIGLTEAGGPTSLLFGVVADGMYLKRVGSGIVGAEGGGSSLTNLDGGWPSSIYGAVTGVDGGVP